MPKFTELFEFQRKTNLRASNGQLNGEYPFFTSSEEQIKYIDKFSFEGDELIFGTGGKASVHYSKNRFSTSADCLIAKSINKNKIFAKYYYYFFRGNMYILERGFRGAGLKHISKTYISDIGLPCPDLAEQKRITDILDKANTLRKKREQSIKMLNDFLKSTFLDMFGKLSNNEKKWQLLTLKDVVKRDKNSMKRGPFGGSLKKEIFVNQGYLVYEQAHAIHNNFDFARYYITEDKYKEMEMFKVVPSDLIISCSGVTLGRIAEIPKNSKQGIINQALLKISLDNSVIDNEYFKFLFITDWFQAILFGVSRGSGIPNLPSISVIKAIKFPVPPISLQQKFTKIVQKVEKLKEKQKESEKELNNLFNSLMQKAFKGESN